MSVQIYERGDDRLAGNIDARGAGWRAHLSLSSGSDDSPVLDHDRRRLDRRAAIASDHPRAFKNDRGRLAVRHAGGEGRGANRQRHEANGR